MQTLFFLEFITQLQAKCIFFMKFGEAQNEVELQNSDTCVCFLLMALFI